MKEKIKKQKERKFKKSVIVLLVAIIFVFLNIHSINENNNANINELGSRVKVSNKGMYVFDLVEIKVNDINIQVDAATNSRLRGIGLMYRENFDRGVLLDYKKLSILPKEIGLWMKNVNFDIEAAYITKEDDNYIIKEINTLYAHDENPVYNENEMTIYAIWEMELGWFKKHNIGINDKITINYL